MPEPPGSSGQLWVVATPIGNLGDITRRAVESLMAAELLVAEDTRRLRALLSHLGIAKKPLRALNAHSSAGVVQQVVERLVAGAKVAYTTDAGTPGVSDPGRALVQASRSAGVAVLAVPGPSALTAALSVCGLVDGPFAFYGFLPRRGSARRDRLREILASPLPSVLFEAPQRAVATLAELSEREPQRQAYLGRELTKLHEQSLSGSLEELAAQGPYRGECVLVVSGARAGTEKPSVAPTLDACLQAALACGVSPSRIARALAEHTGLNRSPLYARALQLQADGQGEPPVC